MNIYITDYPNHGEYFIGRSESGNNVTLSSVADSSWGICVLYLHVGVVLLSEDTSGDAVELQAGQQRHQNFGGKLHDGIC